MRRCGGERHANINGALASPALAQRFATLGLEAAGTTPEEFAAILRSEIAKWRKVVKEANIRVE